jgi:hypothetical protein
MTSVAVKEAPPLAYNPIERYFSLNNDKANKQHLQAVLTDHATYTEIQNIKSVADIAIGYDRKVRKAFSLTTVALSQLCSALAPGLSQVIFSLAGLRSGGRHDEKTVSVAVDIFNDVAKHRFDRVRDSRLVLNRRTNRIEGVIGPRYKFFANKSLLERVENYVTTHKLAPASFSEAVLVGRRLILRYKSDDPIFHLPYNRVNQEPFFGGYQFENTEVGDCSVRGATVLIRQFCDNKAVAPTMDKNRVSHIRNDKFNRKFELMLTRLDVRVEEATKFKKNAMAMLQTSLNIGGTPQQHVEGCEYIITKLVRRGLSKHAASKVVNTAVLKGSYRSDAVDRQGRPLLEVAASRNVYDLFNALTFEAKKCDVIQRLEMEQLGYNMLSGATHNKEFVYE